MKNKKRFLNFLLSLVMVLGLMLGMSLTVKAEGVTILLKGVDITTQTGGDGWTYDSSTNTLTLANFTSGADYNDHIIIKKGDGNFNIVLEGNNTITSNQSGKYGISYEGVGEYTISGNGSLTINTVGIGIRSENHNNKLTVSGGDINIQSSGGGKGIHIADDFGNTGYLNVTGGRLSIAGQTGLVGSLKMSGGELNITATRVNAGPIGIDATDGTGVEVTGGKVAITSSNDGIRLIGPNCTMSVSNAVVTSMCGNYGISSDRDGNTLTIGNNASLVAKGYMAIAAKTINQVPGTGWTNGDGTEGKTDIEISNVAQSINSYKRVMFPRETLPPAEVTKAPTAKTLTYTGSAQELVTAGTPSGGTMQYALSTNATTAPTEGWSDSIPAKTDVGTYYVWYKAVGDATHIDSDAACVTVTIAAKPAPTEAPTSVPTATPKPVPKTGDNANPSLWLAMMLVALIGFAGLAVTGAMKASRKKK